MLYFFSITILLRTISNPSLLSTYVHKRDLKTKFSSSARMLIKMARSQTFESRRCAHTIPYFQSGG